MRQVLGRKLLGEGLGFGEDDPWGNPYARKKGEGALRGLQTGLAQFYIAWEKNSEDTAVYDWYKGNCHTIGKHVPLFKKAEFSLFLEILKVAGTNTKLKALTLKELMLELTEHADDGEYGDLFTNKDRNPGLVKPFEMQAIFGIEYDGDGEAYINEDFGQWWTNFICSSGSIFFDMKNKAWLPNDSAYYQNL